MKSLRAVLMGAALITGVSALASAQAPPQYYWYHRDRDHDRRWDRDYDRRVYNYNYYDRYDRRYSDRNDYRWRDRDDRWRNNRDDWRFHGHDRDHDGDRR